MNNELIKLIGKWPDLVITFLGVLGGGLVALRIAKWQSSNQKAATLKKDKEILQLLVSRLKVELRDNKNIVQKLQETLNYSEKSRMDIWNWAITIVDSFSSNIYEELSKTNIQRNLPKKVEAYLYLSYQMISGLTYMIKQGIAAHEFLLGYSANEEKANKIFKNGKIYSQTVLEHLEDAVKVAYEYDEILSKK